MIRPAAAFSPKRVPCGITKSGWIFWGVVLAPVLIGIAVSGSIDGAHDGGLPICSGPYYSAATSNNSPARFSLSIISHSSSGCRAAILRFEDFD